MSNNSLFGLSRVPLASSFAELNVRTYVVKDGKPGVFFFSLDVNHLLHYTERLDVVAWAIKPV